jgi:hypothetical protein
MKVGLILDRDMITGESFRNWAPFFYVHFSKFGKKTSERGYPDPGSVRG